MNDVIFYHIRSIADYDDMLRCLERADTLFLDSETSGLDPHTSKLLLLQVSNGEQIFIIDFTELPVTELAKAKTLLETKKVVIHNATFDWKIIYHNSGINMKNLHCTMIAEQVLWAGLPEASETNLKAVVLRRLGIEMSKEERNYFINYSGGYIPEEAFIYSARDVDVLPTVYKQQMEEAADKELLRTLELEMRIVSVIAKAEYVGVGFDAEKLKAAIPVYKSAAEKLERDINDIAMQSGFAHRIVFSGGKYRCINTRSTQQILALMKYLGIDVETTGKDVLKEWDDTYALKKHAAITLADEMNGEEDIDIDEEYRVGYTHPFLYKYHVYNLFANMESKAIKLLEHVNPVTHRIHSTILQCGAARTGRMSSKAPNTQNQANNRIYESVGLQDYAIRPMFIPRAKRKLVIRDLKGIEGVILAALSLDENLLRQIQPGHDLHVYVATNLSGAEVVKGRSQKDDIIRDVFKRVTYAIMYGATKWRLYRSCAALLASIGINISLDNADAWIVGWKKLFPQAGRVLEDAARDAVTRGYVTTVIGRRRQWDLAYLRTAGKGAYSAAMRGGSNSKIQSNAADVLKQALVFFDERVDGGKADVVMLVHDEIVVEADDDYAETANKILAACFEDAGALLFPQLERGTITSDGGVYDRYAK